MRLKTVRARLRKAGLPTHYVNMIYEKMLGCSDESTLLNGSHNDFWIHIVAETMSKYLASIKKEAHELLRKTS